MPQKVDNPFSSSEASRSRLPSNVVPIGPAPSSLAIYVHWNCGQASSNSQAANDEERISYPLRRNPIVDIKCKSESETILDKVHDGERFAGFVTMAIHDVGDNTGSSELYAEVDEPKADYHWHFP